MASEITITLLGQLENIFLSINTKPPILTVNFELHRFVTAASFVVSMATVSP